MNLRQIAGRLLSSVGNKLYRNLFFMTSNYPMQNVDADGQVHDGYMYNPDVYAVVNKILSAATTVEWELLEVKDNAQHDKWRNTSLERKAYNPSQAIKTKSEGYEKVTDPSNQLYRLLQRPNPMQSFKDWISNVLGYKLITGNTFIHGIELKRGVNAGLFNEMWVMPAQLMQIKASQRRIIEYYRLMSNATDYVDFKPEEVVHMKYFNPDFRSPENHLWGLSPLIAGSRVVKQSNEAYTANESLLKNAGASGVLSVDPEHMTEEQAQRLQDRYQREYGGSYNRGKIIIAGGSMNWQQIGLSPVDLNILESQKMSLRDLCNIYEVSSALFNDPDNNTYANMQEARKALYMEKVFPELDVVRDELNRWLVSRYNQVMGTNYYLDYNIYSVPAVQDDVKKLVESVWNAYWLTGNERRMAMGYEFDPAMEKYFVPTGVQPFSREQLESGMGVFDDRGNGRNDELVNAQRQ